MKNEKNCARSIIALDFKYEQQSPRPRSPSQWFLSAVCIYSLALLLIYIQNLYVAESLVSALYLYLLAKDKECCANEDSDLYNVKNYGS